MTTRLSNPPKFRLWSYFALTAPPPAAGVILGLTPVVLVIMSFTLLLKGDTYIDMDWQSQMSYWLIDGIVSHYTKTKIDPEVVTTVRFGRIGLCFLISASYLLYTSTMIFLPKEISVQEKINKEKNDTAAMNHSIWTPTMWKRSNLIFCSIMMSMFLVVLVEFSFWEGYGTYIWYIIIAFEFLGVYVEGVVENQLKESLLCAPLNSALSLTLGLVTFGSDDFQDFLLGYILDFGIVLIQRVYLDTALDAFFNLIYSSIDAIKSAGRTFLRLTIFRKKHRAEMAAKKAEEALSASDAKKDAKAKVEADDEPGETVEPIIDNYSGYAMDTLAMFYQPFLIMLMLFFRYEMVLPITYGILEQHMEYYLWFSIVILFFQLVADVYVLNVLELFHGWKIYDYLVYSRYRFLQREHRWKGMEPNLDECVEEGMRTLDQLCFSSQFYMICTLHVTAIMMLVLAIEMMIRHQYNMFGDPAMPVLAAYVLTSCVVVQRSIMYFAQRFEIWKIRHAETAWHALPGDAEDAGIPRWEELEKIKGASHEAYLMNQRMTSETFRHKFLNYNRPWIVQQLPSILTPRTLRRGKPYLIAQFTKILNSLNPEISSDDSDGDDALARPRFGPVSLSAPSRTIIRLWLAKARRVQRLRQAVQPIINANRKVECDVCLSRRQLQVELVIPLEVMGDKFERTSANSSEFDVTAWKAFFKQHEKFRTLCLSCASKEKLGQAPSTGLTGTSYDSDPEVLTRSSSSLPQFPPVVLKAASAAIVQKWYRRAQDRVFGASGKKRMRVHVSDDEDDPTGQGQAWAQRPLQLNSASIAIVRKWWSASQNRIKVRRPLGAASLGEKGQVPSKPTRKRPTAKASATSRRSRNRRK